MFTNLEKYILNKFFCYENVIKVLSVNVYKMCQPWSSTAMKIRVFIWSESFKVNLRLVYTDKIN